MNRILCIIHISSSSNISVLPLRIVKDTDTFVLMLEDEYRKMVTTVKLVLAVVV